MTSGTTTVRPPADGRLQLLPLDQLSGTSRLPHRRQSRPGQLGVSADLVARLEAWHREWEDANHGGPMSPDWDDEWERRGWELAQQLQGELGPGFAVRYHGYDGAEERSLLGRTP